MSGPEKPLNTAGEITSTFYGSRLFLKFFLWVWLTLVLTGITVAVYGYFYHFEPEKQRFFNISREIIGENGQTLVNAYEKLGIDSIKHFRLPGSFWLYDAEINLVFAGKPARHRISHRNETADQGKYDDRGHSPDDVPPPPHDEIQPAPPPRPDTPPDKPEWADGKKPWFKGDFNKFERLFSEKEPEIRTYAAKLLSEQTPGSETVAGEMLIGATTSSDSGKKYVIICHIPNKMPMPAKFLIYRLLENLPIFLLATGLLCFWLSRYMVKPVIEMRAASRNFAHGDLKTRVTGDAIRRYDELGDLAADFNEMAEKIEKMINGQRRLFGDISHELRSPLARLQVSLELLQNRVGETEQPMLSRIGREISRMNALIEELLQFNRLESGETNGQKQTVGLQASLKHICNDAGFEGRARNLTVSLKAEEEVTVTGNPQLIERAIENILRNALKYSPDGSTIGVELKRAGDRATIDISDQGPGIPHDELQKVFSPFYCLSEDRNPQKGGIGLGLAIAERAIRLHQGQITLSNRPEGGLTATISLPANS